MKRSMAVFLALTIGFLYNPPGAVALAEENDKKLAETEEYAALAGSEEHVAAEKDDEESTTQTEIPFVNNLLGNVFSLKEETKELSDGESKKLQEVEKDEMSDREAFGMKNLQIPQKLDVVIDPWEIDGKGQVYSEEYIIRNTGEMPGILTLSNLACKPREQSGVIVRTEKEGLHDSGDKSIYMEMLFGNGERVIFSQEHSNYQTELKPDEELSLCFGGEVNENAFGKWGNDDVAVSVVYSWKMEGKQDDIAAEDPEENLQTGNNAEEIEKKQQEEINPEDIKEKQQTEKNQESTKEKQQTEEDLEDTKERQRQEGSNNTKEKQQGENPEEKTKNNVDKEKPQEQQNNTSETVLEKESSEVADGESRQQPGLNFSDEETDGQEVSEAIEEEEKRIELREPQKVDVVIDSWKVNEERQIVSSKYILENTGDITGIWNLSELVCKPREESGIKICADRQELQDSERKSIYLELVLGNGKRVVISNENSDYEVKLEPGESLSVCFVAEGNESIFEAGEETDIMVTAVCSWNMEQITEE